MRDEDVQVPHGFATADRARAHLDGDLFIKDLVSGLTALAAFERRHAPPGAARQQAGP